MTLFLYYTENRLTNKVGLRYSNSGLRINIPTYVAHFISPTVPLRLQHDQVDFKIYRLL